VRTRKHMHAAYAAFSQSGLAQSEVVFISLAASDIVAVLRRWAKSRHMPAVAIPTDKKPYQQQIEATHGQIHAPVYDLYGLSEDESVVVEGS